MSNNTTQQKRKLQYYVKETRIDIEGMTLEESIAEITEAYQQAMEEVLKVNNVKRPYYNIEIPDGHPFELLGSLFSSGDDDDGSYMSFLVQRDETDAELAKRLQDAIEYEAKKEEVKYRHYLELQKYYSDSANIPLKYQSDSNF